MYLRFEGNPLEVCQEVMLFGRGISEFAAARDGITAIYKLFVTNYVEGTFRKYSEGAVGGLPGLEFRTQYFTNPKLNGVAEDIPIPIEIDPHGVLQTCMKKKGLRYTTENVVIYRQRRCEFDGENS